MMSPMVQDRIGKTFGFFSYGLFSTGACVYALRNSLVWTRIPQLALFGASLATLFATHMVPYDSALPLKLALYTGFTGLTGITILPLVQMSSIAMIADAALATGVAMTSLAAVAYNAPSE